MNHVLNKQKTKQKYYDLLLAKAYFYILMMILAEKSKVNERISLKTNLYVNTKYHGNIKLFSACNLIPFYTKHL